MIDMTTKWGLKAYERQTIKWFLIWFICIFVGQTSIMLFIWPLEEPILRLFIISNMTIVIMYILGFINGVIWLRDTIGETIEKANQGSPKTSDVI